MRSRSSRRHWLWAGRERPPYEIEHSGRIIFISAVFGNGLRLFEPGLSEKLRILHCQRQEGRRSVKVADL